MSQATSDNLSFCDALRAIMAGQRAQRAGWNGKGLCVFLKAGSAHGPFFGFEPGAEVQADNPATIDGVSVSLFRLDAPQDTAIRLPHVCLSYPTGTSVAWAPSQTDMLASDWSVLPSLAIEAEPVANEPARRGVLVIKAKDEPLVVKALREHGAVIIKRELFDMNQKTSLIIEHADLEPVTHGAIMPRYELFVSDQTLAIEFRKAAQ